MIRVCRQARHTPVPVRERVNHDEIQMRHRAFDQDMIAVLVSSNVGDETADQFYDIFGGGAFVDRQIPFLIANVDGSRAPIAGMPGQIVLQHHEVEAPQNTFIEGERRILHKLEHECHCISVPQDFTPCCGLRLQGLFAFNGGHGIVLAHQVAFDTVRSPDGSCQRVSANGSIPPWRSGKRIFHLCMDAGNRRNDLKLLRVQPGAS